MVRKDVEEYLTLLLAQIKITGGDARKLISMAITVGEDYFFKANHWSFKEKSDTVTTTASTETVDLPDDFSAILSLREKDTLGGVELQSLKAAKYDRVVPDSASLTTGKPRYYKLFFDSDSGIWKLALYPTPDAAYTLYLNYHVNGLGIPTDFFDAYVASVVPYIYPHGTKARKDAIVERDLSIAMAIQRDDPDASMPDRVFDADESTPLYNLRPWDDGHVWSGS